MKGRRPARSVEGVITGYDLISPDSKRTEPGPREPHFHVWIDRGRVLIIKRPRFPTRQAARNTALRRGYKPGTFIVRKCECPCRLEKPQ